VVDQLPRLELAKREPVSTEVARALLDYIFSGEVQPGARLPSERQLAESFGVGRSVVREALKSLGLLGLVEFRQGGGTYFRGADSELLPRVIEWGLMLGERRTLDLVETRQHMEVLLARLAAQRRDADDLRAMQQHLREMKRSKTTDDFVDADVAFHLAVAKASKNSVLISLHSSIASLLHVWIHRVITAADSNAPSYDEHVPIFDAVKAGDADAAAATMARHMDAAADRLRAALAADGDAPNSDDRALA
jgi:GntR family transcriptional repressor for pyruvate dehydrogenase complex